MKGAQSCPTLWDPVDYTVHGILQARILEWVAFPFSRGSSQPRNQTWVSCIAGRFFTTWAMRAGLSKLFYQDIVVQSLSQVWLLVTPWTVAHQAPLFLWFPREEYWSELPFPSPGDLPDPEFEPMSPALQNDSLPLSHQGSPSVIRNLPIWDPYII